MRHRLLLAATAAAALSLAACSDSTTAPRRFQPGTLRTDMSPGPDGSCRGGYHLIARSDGTLACEQD